MLPTRGPAHVPDAWSRHDRRPKIGFAIAFTRVILPQMPHGDTSRAIDARSLDEAEVSQDHGACCRRPRKPITLVRCQWQSTGSARSPLALRSQSHCNWSQCSDRIQDVGHPGEQMLSVFQDYGVVTKDSRNNLNKTAENRNIYRLVHPGWSLMTNRMKAWQGSVGTSTLPVSFLVTTSASRRDIKKTHGS